MLNPNCLLCLVDNYRQKLTNICLTQNSRLSLAGSYLSGLVHFLSLFPDSTVLGITETMGLDQATAAILQVPLPLTLFIC